MSFLNEYAPLLLRIGLVVLFPFSALDKVVNWNAAMDQAGRTRLAPAMLVAAILIEALTPICIVTGWHDHAAAFLLAGFCAVTAVLYHQFWRDPDFWRFKEGKGLAHFWDFLKNFGLVGGLGLIVLAPHTGTVSEAFQHPWASSYVTGERAGTVVPDGS